jgi:TolA-binding protein
MTRPPWCPAPHRLERAARTGPPARLARHLRLCQRCRDSLADIQALRHAARQLPAPVANHPRHEELRAALLVAARADRCRRDRPLPRWPVAAAASALAAALLLLALRRTGPADPGRAPLRGSVEASRGAHFTHLRTTSRQAASDEVVRLTSGQVSIAVKPLSTGERFRVVTGDAEIEVHGTAFDVLAEADRLRRITVREGIVSLRRTGRPLLRLRAGQGWARGDEAPVTGPETRPGAPADTPEPAAQRDLPARSGTPLAAPSPLARQADLRRLLAVLGAAFSPLPAARPAAGAGVERHGIDAPAPVHGAGQWRRRAARRGPAAQPLDPAQDRPAAASVDRAAPATETSALPPAALPPAALPPAALPPAALPPAAPPLPGRAATPSASELGFVTGWNALRLGNYGVAADAFAHVLTTDPAAPLAEDARYWRAVALARAGSPQARDAMRRFLRRHPASQRSPQMAVMLGWRALAAGDRPEAARAFRWALAHRPEPPVRRSAEQGLARLAAPAP